MTTTPDFAKDWWRGAVIYQIYPRSFMDANNDGIGDIKGITAKLDYVGKLGVDAIWVSPFFQSPMKDFGYDVSDYTKVDPLFGSMEDLDELIKRANTLGLKVMVDLVLSHTSDEHPWFKESRSSRDNPKSDWYVWADPSPDGTPPNNWMSIFGGSSWEWDTKRRQYYLHNFLTSQPDLNYHNPEVRKAMLDIAKFWLDRGVRGFRLDAVNFIYHHQSLKSNPVLTGEPLDYVPASNPYGMQEHLYDKTQPEALKFLEDFRTLMDHYEGATSVGEMGARDALRIMADYTEYGKRLHMLYTFNFLNEKFGPQHFRSTVEYVEKYIRHGWPCWAFNNHDVTRAATRWCKDVKLRPDFAKLMAALLTSFRGSSCIYEGEELGLPEAEVPFELIQDPYGKRFWPEFKGRDGCRTPMPWESGKPHAGFSTHAPWLPVPEEHKALAVDKQESNPASVLHFYRHLLQWRKQHPALCLGSIAFMDVPDPLLAFYREWKDETLLCVFNLGANAMEVSLPDAKKLSPLGDSGFPATLTSNTLNLPPYGAFFAAVTG